ncbi:Lrp/AsnC family transcriptional regulator [Arthrobacter gandavensis]|uniref:Lrp/AsnC family transcriptional regulator n=1 Tax=Arthrobacter gandavensis TaxID=169960 RepID=UPI00188FC355|nr:Lrp/AsnC family transcriptional regulator [Arthrobacter gandavensis]MBF4994558.1 Lrp/AsnC family transcriptional regulator [Arthrobacter gandavensis]
MDATDSSIVSILQREARISFAELGRRVGLSTNAAAARVRRLETAGIILGYRAVLAEEEQEPGAGLQAFIDVRLKPEADSRSFLAWAQDNPAVRDAVHVTGPYDYLLNVRVPGMPALDALLHRLKTESGALQTQTRLALR